MILAATEHGVHDLDTGDASLDDRDVAFLATSGDEAWALTDRGRTVLHKITGSAWHELARIDGDPGLVLHPIGAGRALLGTAGAHVVLLGEDGARPLPALDSVAGRDHWYNPASPGRPDVWSFASDGDTVFVSVHVGGLWRSDDLGETWRGSLDPEVDVHQVVAGDGVVAVVAQGGFGISDDVGSTWSWTTDGLHAPYLQSVALDHGAVFVGASSGPFGDDAAIYRASPPGAAFERRSNGLPERFEAIGPSHIVADGQHLAVAAWFADHVFHSFDGGASWARHAATLPRINSLAIA